MKYFLEEALSDDLTIKGIFLSEEESNISHPVGGMTYYLLIAKAEEKSKNCSDYYFEAFPNIYVGDYYFVGSKFSELEFSSRDEALLYFKLKYPNCEAIE